MHKTRYAVDHIQDPSLSHSLKVLSYDEVAMYWRSVGGRGGEEEEASKDDTDKSHGSDPMKNCILCTSTVYVQILKFHEIPHSE